MTGQDGALVPAHIEVLLDAFEITPTGLLIHGEPSEQQTIAFANWAMGVREKVDWVIGDILNYGEQHFEDFLDHLGWAEQTRSNVASVCRRIPRDQRLSGLSFSAHAAAAYLPPEQRMALLTEAAKAGLSRDDVRQQVRELRGGPKIKPFSAMGHVSIMRTENDGQAIWTLICELEPSSMSRVDDLPDGVAKVLVSPLLSNEQVYIKEG